MRNIAFHETRTVRPRCEALIRIRYDRDNSLRADISPSLCDAWLSRTKVLFRSDSTCSGHGTCVSVGAVGGDTHANLSDFILSREINCGT